MGKLNKFKNSIKSFGEDLRSKRGVVLLIMLVITVFFLIGYSFNARNKYRMAIENNYNMAFYELNDYVRNLEVYLAKSMITNSPESGAENLTYIWREANLAQTYLAMLPMETVELEKTQQFLNQVSDYSYSLSRKTINNEDLSQGDLDNLSKMHDYSLEMEKILNQLSLDMNSGRITWSELTREINPGATSQVSNLSKDSFSSLEENFHEYAGLIYDGAFSEHMTNGLKTGLVGEDVNETQAEEIVKNFIGNDKIKEMVLNNVSDDASIPSFDYSINTVKDENIWISISKKGGHIVFMNYNRNVAVENIGVDEADNIICHFLSKNGFDNMKKTYYTKNSGIMTINYAYEQDNIIVYPDLIKVKIALDNGEIIGIETTGYLNCHKYRDLPEIKVSAEEAKKKINENLNIESQRLAIIPTEFQTELTCWEFKGTLNDRDFLVYINVENGREEDILIILNSEDGVLTM